MEQTRHIKNNGHNERNEHNEHREDKEFRERRQFFPVNLLSWYEENRRDLPWRRTRDPYRIWVSEVMLQQTRVETVIPYYHRFIEKFPSLQALADAPEEEVLKAWEGLGYYARARNLQAAVREVRESYGGVVPAEKESISSLKGVGSYTSGAILSIAYNQPEAAVDGNVMRVLSRFFLIENDIARPGTRTIMERLAKDLIPPGRASDFNQALMELGAIVCTPKTPYCLTCPVMEKCGARLNGMEQSLPVKAKAKAPRPERRIAALIEWSDRPGLFLIRQRPPQGLLAGMWELPHYKLSAADIGTEQDENLIMTVLRESAVRDGLPIQPEGRLLQIGHTFSHIHWDMSVYRCTLTEKSDAEATAGLTTSGIVPTSVRPPHFAWICLDDLKKYPFPNIFLKIFQTVYRSEA